MMMKIPTGYCQIAIRVICTSNRNKINTCIYLKHYVVLKQYLVKQIISENSPSSLDKSIMFQYILLYSENIRIFIIHGTQIYPRYSDQILYWIVLGSTG